MQSPKITRLRVVANVNKSPNSNRSKIPKITRQKGDAIVDQLSQEDNPQQKSNKVLAQNQVASANFIEGEQLMDMTVDADDSFYQEECGSIDDDSEVQFTTQRQSQNLNEK